VAVVARDHEIGAIAVMIAGPALSRVLSVRLVGTHLYGYLVPVDLPTTSYYFLGAFVAENDHRKVGCYASQRSKNIPTVEID